MYMFMNHIISPEANAKVAEYFGEAPSNTKSCAVTADKEHCKTFHADDEAYFDKVAYWTTPVKDCGDARGEVCKDYSDWVTAWTERQGLDAEHGPSRRRPGAGRPSTGWATGSGAAAACSWRCCWPPRSGGWWWPTSGRWP